MSAERTARPASEDAVSDLGAFRYRGGGSPTPGHPNIFGRQFGRIGVPAS